MPAGPRIAAAFATFALGTFASFSEAPRYNKLYVFGDSYSDVGNLYIALNEQSPLPQYYPGRFSNGPIWVDHIAGFLGLPLTPSLAGGTDYAWGGALVTGPNGVIPSVPDQVAQYLEDHGGKADRDALYIVEGGINDIVTSDAQNTEELGSKIALGLTKCEEQLVQAGARHVLVSNLFNVGLLPVASAKAIFAAAATASTNEWLDRLLLRNQGLNGAHIFRLNFFRLMDAILKDPTHFGFNNVTSPCISASVCSDPDRWLFFDTYHPTEFAHSYFAVEVEGILEETDRD
jgi:phospholipase/lecithinase/hemolysin